MRDVKDYHDELPLRDAKDYDDELPLRDAKDYHDGELHDRTKAIDSLDAKNYDDTTR